MLRKQVIFAPLLSIAVCAFLLALYNFTFWQSLLHTTTLLSLIAISTFILIAMYAILMLVSFQYIYKPFLLLIIFVATISLYATEQYGFVITANAFHTLIESDVQEIKNLINLYLFIVLFCLFVLPAIVILKLKIQYPKIKTKLVHLTICLVLCSGNLLLFGKYYAYWLRNHRHIRYYLNPTLPVYSFTKFALQKLSAEIPRPIQLLDERPVRINNPKPKLVVLVVGESDRAMNQYLNGYPRNTNPRLAQRKDVFSFTNVLSCGTETNVSIPCMFSPFTRKDYVAKKARYTENVLDLLQKAQVQVVWRDNDSGCKHVCDRVHTEDLNHASIKPYCDDVECLDEVLLHDLEKYTHNDVRDKLIVLHKRGNHGPAYYKRYPKQFSKFSPVCNSNRLHTCSDAQLLNTYDNIILYTDYFLDKIIANLESLSEQYQTALLYVSDHGESLGEKGIYLHAMPYWLAPREQTHVPLIFWASQDFAINQQLIAQRLHQEFSHDNLFHTLLGMFAVQTKAYVPELDMFSDHQA